jgi:uncharacterized protein YneF (UPF0154 family)
MNLAVGILVVIFLLSKFVKYELCESPPRNEINGTSLVAG